MNSLTLISNWFHKKYAKQLHQNLFAIDYHHHLQKYFYYRNITLNYYFICKINIGVSLSESAPGTGAYHIFLCDSSFSCFLSNILIFIILLVIRTP